MGDEPAFGRGRGGPGGWIILVQPAVHPGPDVLVPDMAGWRRARLPRLPEGAWRMGTFRYVLAVLMLVSVPISLGLWFLIHPLAHVWRRVGPLATYAVLAVPASALGLWLWANRPWLIGRDLGTQPVLVLLGVLAFAVGAGIARRRRRELTQRILIGVPELSGERGRLLTQGMYARTRNPRYLEFLCFVLGYVAIANFTGTWVLWLLCFPAIHVVVLLEERELLDRFGAEYEDYCRRVPRYLPRRP